MKKRVLCLLLALVLLLGLTACALDETDAAALGEALVRAAEELETDASEEELVLLPDTEAPSPTPEAAPQEAAEEPDDAPEPTPAPAEGAPDGIDGEPALDRDGVYTSKEDVALYLHLYGELPQNFITKTEARALGWSGGGLDGYADGMSIGGDRFGNYEGILPAGSYRECDIDTMHKSGRGAKRLVYSDDGRIYYTEDHYESFELLYGEE